MKIGVDARLHSQTGVGRYIRNLICELARIDGKNSYVVFLTGGDFETFKLPDKNWKKVRVNVRWHTLREQLVMPFILYKERLDLVHFPYFNVPIFYFRRYIVTIHDLTHLHFDTGRASTLPWVLYKLKRIGMKIILSKAIKRAEKVIAVSKATKREIVEHFGVDSKKIKVIYEGVDDKIIKAKGEDLKVRGLGRFILYVGNAYPHKNLERLIEAFGEFKKRADAKEIKLVLVGPDDYFYRQLKKKTDNSDIIFFGPADDRQLNSFYSRAEFLVLPSLMEGFGLVGLEAMSLGCPVVASDIEVLREVYGCAAMFFNPKDIGGLASKMEKFIKDKELRVKLIKKGKERAGIFSWRRMGKETLKTYQALGVSSFLLLV